MGHGGARIARGRSQNGHRFVAADVSQHLRHKAAAEVFKGQGRAVEQLKAAHVRLDVIDRRREGERRTHALFQQFLRDFIADKRRQNFSAAGDKILFQQFIDIGQRKFRQVVGKNSPGFCPGPALPPARS